MKKIMPPSVHRGACALVFALPVALCSSTAGAAIMCADNFEGSGNCGIWSVQGPAPSSEWSVDSTTDVGNKFYKRVDGSGTSGAWNDSKNGNSYGDMTVTGHMRIDSWNGTGNDQATMYARYNPAGQGGIAWYSVSLTADGRIHIRKNIHGTITNLLDIGDVHVQPGEWFNLRVETIGPNAAPASVAVNVYLDDVWEGSIVETSNYLSSGFMAFGSFGATLELDDVTVGDYNDTLAPAYDGGWHPTDCSRATGNPGLCAESGEISRLSPLKTDRLWWMHGARPDFDRWAMNGAINVFDQPESLSSTPWARKGL